LCNPPFKIVEVKDTVPVVVGLLRQMTEAGLQLDMSSSTSLAFTTLRDQLLIHLGLYRDSSLKWFFVSFKPIWEGDLESKFFWSGLTQSQSTAIYKSFLVIGENAKRLWVYLENMQIQ